MAPRLVPRPHRLAIIGRDRPPGGPVVCVPHVSNPRTHKLASDLPTKRPRLKKRDPTPTGPFGERSLPTSPRHRTSNGRTSRQGPLSERSGGVRAARLESANHPSSPHTQTRIGPATKRHHPKKNPPCPSQTARRSVPADVTRSIARRTARESIFNPPHTPSPSSSTGRDRPPGGPVVCVPQFSNPQTISNPRTRKPMLDLQANDKTPRKFDPAPAGPFGKQPLPTSPRHRTSNGSWPGIGLRAVRRCARRMSRIHKPSRPPIRNPELDPKGNDPASKNIDPAPAGPPGGRSLPTSQGVSRVARPTISTSIG